MKLDSINAVVTGGASGIGRAVCELIVERGGTAMVADIDGEAAEATASAIGDRAIPHVCDVRDVDAIEAMVETAWERMGGVDLALANAGISTGGPLLKARPEQFDVIYEINIRGAWATCAAFARRMIAEGRTGHVSVTGSEHSLGMQHAGTGQYTASKHAVLGWADVMRHELPENVTISVLFPGVVSTNLYKLPEGTGLPQTDPRLSEVSRKIMEQGMSPRECAEIYLKGVEEGAFLIPTHAWSRHAAERRWQEIDQAFARYAPPGSDSEKYDTSGIIEQVVEAARRGE